MGLYVTILLEILLISSSILLLFKFRENLGLAPLYILLGSVQYLQSNLGSSFSIIIFEYYEIYPSSIILFSSVLFAVLLIYIKEGVASSRTLILGIVISNVIMTFMFEITNFQKGLGSVINGSGLGPDIYFLINFKFFLIGTIILLIDFLLITIIYQFLFSKIKILPFFLILFISLFTVLIFDSFVFNFFLFYGSETFKSSLVSHLFGKTIASVVFTILLYVYLKLFEKEKTKSTTFIASQDRDIYSILKYRQRYLNLKIEKEETENKLKSHIETTLNNISDGFVSLDANWCYTYINKKASEFLGRSPENLMGKHIWTEFPEGVGLPFYKAYHEAFETQKTIYFEEYYEPFDKWFENRIYPSPEGLTIYFTDITENKKSDINNQLLLSLIETSDSFIGLATLEGVPLYLNANGRKLVGLKKKGGLSGSIADFFPEDYKEVIEKEHMASVFKNNKWVGEAEFQNFKTGKQIPIDMSGFLISDSVSNKPMALGIVAANITERKGTELEIELMQQKIEAAIRIGNIGYWSWDIKKDEVFWSDLMYEIYDVEKNTILKYDTVLSRVHPDDRSFHDKLTSERINNKSNGSFEYRVLCRDNTVKYVMVQMEVVDDNLGNAIKFQGTVVDITKHKKAEENLIKSEKLFRRLTSQAPAGIFQTDLDGACSYVNDQWTKYAGISFEDAMGYGWATAIHPDDSERVSKEWEEHILTGNIQLETEFRFQHKDKKVTWVSVKTVGTYDAQNDLSGYIGMAIDVTDRKRAEENLIKSELLFRGLTSNAPVGIFQTDKTGSCNFVNEQWIEYSGISFNEAMGFGWSNAIHPIDKERVLKAWEASINTDEKYLIDLRFLNKKTKSTTWLSVKSEPLFDTNNNLYGYIGICIDITERKKTEDELIKSELLFRGLTSNAPVGIFKADKEGSCNYVNEEWLRYSGLSLEESLGFGWLDAIHPEDKDMVMNEWKRALSLHEVYLMDSRFLNKKNGKVNWVSVKALGLYDANKELYGYVGMCIDITARKRATQEIRKAHQRLTTHLNNSPLAVIEWDKNLIITNWSTQAKSIFEWEEKEVIGKHFSDINLVFEKDAEATGIIVNELMKGEVKSNRIINRNNTKTGKVIYCEWYNSVLLSENGEIETIFSLVQDVTERIKSEQNIRESEAKFSKVFHSNIIGYSVVNIDQVRIDVNTTMAKMLESTREHLIGKTFEEANVYDLDSAYYKQKKELYKKVIEEGFIRNETLNRTLTSGKKISLLVSIEPIKIAGETHALFSVIDITELKTIELELETYRNNLEKLVEIRTNELNKEKVKAQSADLMKSAFLATMSHELRTPMNSIIGFTGILLKEYAGPLNEEQKKQLGMVKNSSQHLLGLINDVLDISKIEAGKLNVLLAPFNYLTTLEKTIEFLEPQAAKKGLVINSEISELNITLNSDERRVEQVLLNLLSNAIKFSEEGEIKVKVDIKNDFVVTQIIDQGLGIERRDIKKLFLPFIQINDGLNRTHDGTGLGLAICKNLIEKLGGTINVESKKNEGSKFTFFLPFKNLDHK